MSGAEAVNKELGMKLRELQLNIKEEKQCQKRKIK